MKVICQYCHTPIRSGDGKPDEQTSHGVCEACLPRLAADMSQSLPEFLDSLETPIVVVEGDARVVGANAAARRFLVLRDGDFVGALAGDVLGCSHAGEPGGCGRTVHCQSCTIRQSVNTTFRTGEPCDEVPAFRDLGTLTGDHTTTCTISTRMAGAFVVLAVDTAKQEI